MNKPPHYSYMVLSPPGSCFWELSWPQTNHISKGFNIGPTWDQTWSADRRKAVKVIPISIGLNCHRTTGRVIGSQSNWKICSRTSPKSHNSLLTTRLYFPCDSFTRESTYFSKDLNVKLPSVWTDLPNLSFWCICLKFLIFFFFFITETFGISDIQDIQLIHVSLACYHSN